MEGAQGQSGGAPGQQPRPRSPRLSRRVLVGIGAAGALGLLTSRGLRVDLPEPEPPAPTRRAVPDEALLVSTVRELRDLRALLARLPGSEAKHAPARAAAAIVEEQDRVLTGRLTNDGVPTEVIDGPQRAVVGPTPAPSPGPATRADVAAALAAAPALGWGTVAGAAAPNRLVLLSATSARFAAAVRLGRPLPLTGRAPEPVRAALLEETRPLVYGFEVAAAQLSEGARRQAEHTVEALQALAEQLESGGSAAPPPGGWRLPFPVRTTKDAERLIRDLIRRAVAATTTTTVARSAGGLEELARWSGRVQALGPPHGVPLTAFPGTVLADGS